MAIPRPGKPVRGSQSGAPIMAVFDLLGRRWAMGIVWNLYRGPATFRVLQTRCETISPSILNSRLKDLREAGLVDRGDNGYQLTHLGQELFQLLKPLGEWSIEWARQVTDESQAYWDACLERMKKHTGLL
jgi:DNA-binding HxlR family transcriptional regulator